MGYEFEDFFKEAREIEKNKVKLNLNGVMPTLVLFAEWLQYNGKWDLPEKQAKDFIKEQQKQK